MTARTYEEVERAINTPIMPADPGYFIIMPRETPEGCLTDPVIAWTVGPNGEPSPVGAEGYEKAGGTKALLCPGGKIIGPMVRWPDGKIAGQSFNSVQEWLDHEREKAAARDAMPSDTASCG
jgi:hypothetical protein